MYVHKLSNFGGKFKLRKVIFLLTSGFFRGRQVFSVSCFGLNLLDPR